MPGRQERERERLRKVALAQKMERWHNPSEATIQREEEYRAWAETRPQQFGDEPRNDTYESFLVERRRAKEKERLRLVAERRKAERQLLEQQSPPRAVVPPAVAKRPRGRPRDPLTPQRQQERRKLEREAAQREREAIQLERDAGHAWQGSQAVQLYGV